MIATFRKLLALLAPRARLAAVLLVVPMTFASLLEMAGIAMILPLLHALFGGGAGGGLGAALRALFADLLPERLLIAVMAAFAALQVVKNLALLATTYVISRFVQGQMVATMQRLFALYLHRPFLFHRRTHSAAILRNLLFSTPKAFDGLLRMMNILLDAVLIVGVAALLLAIEPAMTALIGGGLAGAALLFNQLMAPRFRHWGARGHEFEQASIKIVNEGFGAIKDIQVLGCQAYVIDRLRRMSDAWARVLIRSITAHLLPRLFVETVVVVGFLAIALAMLESRGSAEGVIAILGLYGMAAFRLMPSMNRILGNLAGLRERSAAIETLHTDLDDVLGTPAVPVAAPPAGGRHPFGREIRLESLSFAYEEGAAARKVLDGVTLAIAKGESVGIVGSSGSGKSTLMDILLGLVPPAAGRVLVDGRDIAADPAAWQAEIGYVPQHIYLLDDSLKRNIAFGAPDSEIDPARLTAAVGLANLAEVVARLPQGLDTPLGENGYSLSGGQRQRVGIARALYRDPAVLMFDEATSALDNESEREIVAAIAALKGRKTVIIIAHRLSTVATCDRLVFLKEGRVVDSGTFAELCQRSAEFRRFAGHEAVPAAVATG